ncbi:hypothetical protein ACFQ3P_38005 [Paraburkholderia sabiae]|uniref:Methyl-accepting chemotaxis protein n=1 Tax=Paraburkholderia sabiae TaxID=273251 RepID=A0ABU9QPL8_9BURK|nr:hypothetical protein [Paraburkholderia sabiae]WJZ72228.1 hypothetical protein QEN71_18820 [Paraburkholderia sabiae]
MQFASQDQLVRQKISLAVASAGGVLLLLFALLTRQRAALAKLPSTIAAIEAQRTQTATVFSVRLPRSI